MLYYALSVGKKTPQIAHSHWDFVTQTRSLQYFATTPASEVNIHILPHELSQPAKGDREYHKPISTVSGDGGSA